MKIYVRNIMYVLKRCNLRKISKGALSEAEQKNGVGCDEGMGNGRVDVLVGQWVVGWVGI
jgi:hypothetical protein